MAQNSRNARTTRTSDSNKSNSSGRTSNVFKGSNTPKKFKEKGDNNYRKTDKPKFERPKGKNDRNDSTPSNRKTRFGDNAESKNQPVKYSRSFVTKETVVNKNEKVEKLKENIEKRFNESEKPIKKAVLKPRQNTLVAKKEKAKIETTRLNKYLANAGICSRREADELIKTGVISVNGEIVTQVGTKIMPGDQVKYNGARVSEERKVYVLLNKPKDFITTVDDPFAKKTVMHLVQNMCKERIYPVGRLDKDTTGVLLLTNDGDLTKKLTHPKYNKKKIYHVFLDKNVAKTDLVKLSEGFMLDDGYINADAVSYVDDSDKKQVGVEIHSGRNHIVKRMFEFLGYRVVKLDRVYFAGLTKKGLRRGQARFLLPQEISMLKGGSYN